MYCYKKVETNFNLCIYEILYLYLDNFKQCNKKKKKLQKSQQKNGCLNVKKIILYTYTGR